MSIRRWEKDKNKPTQKYLPKLIEFIGYDPDPQT